MNNSEQEFLVQKIRTQYTEKEFTGLDKLKALDKKVRRPANIFAYTFGIIGALIMGSGMSLVMTEIAPKLGISHNDILGVIIGVIGLLIIIINYPIYNKILTRRKAKYKNSILELSNSIINE